VRHVSSLLILSIRFEVRERRRWVFGNANTVKLSAKLVSSQTLSLEAERAYLSNVWRKRRSTSKRSRDSKMARKSAATSRRISRCGTSVFGLRPLA